MSDYTGRVEPSRLEGMKVYVRCQCWRGVEIAFLIHDAAAPVLYPADDMCSGNESGGTKHVYPRVSWAVR